jgi:hypothetical protein
MQEYFKLVMQDNMVQYNTLSSHNQIMNAMTKEEVLLTQNLLNVVPHPSHI